MAKTMRAFVMKGLNEFGFVEKTLIEDPGPNGAIVTTTRALICTSDCHTVHGAIGERHNLTLGHEAVGIIHKVGSQVTVAKEGEKAFHMMDTKGDAIIKPLILF